MCDKDSLSLRNIQQSVPRREPKVILQRAEYIFPALKKNLVSVFVFVHVERKAINVYFQKIIFGKFATKYFSSLVQHNCLKFLLTYHIVFGTYCHIRNLLYYIFLCKLSYRCSNLQFLNVKLKFCKYGMKRKLVCEVYCRNKLRTCSFKNDSISIVWIGKVT